MATQDKLGLRWAATGGVTDPGATKYQTGWIVEIPTFQNFNYVLQTLDSNILVHAEEGEWFYESTITYQPGAKVKGSDGIFYRCHTESTGLTVTGADPVADSLGNYWTKGQVFGVTGNDVATVDGIKLKGVVPSAAVTWEGTDLTIENGTPMMAFNTTGATENWLLGNISGELVVVATGTVVGSADGRAMGVAEANTFRVFHEGNPPTQEQVADTIPANEIDGKIYARKDTQWVPVTTTTVSASPPPPSIGAGQNWYNLSDGQSYTDIDDGDSSQWVPTMAPVIADGSDGADGINGTNGTDGVDGIDGAPGAQGIAGINGDDGSNGLDGAPGVDGTDGSGQAKNILRNPDLAYWSRNKAEAYYSQSYPADNWYQSAATTPMGSLRRNFLAGQTEVPDSPKHYYEASVDGDAGGVADYGQLQQRMPDVTIMEGKTYTLSFWAKCLSLSGSFMSTEAFQVFGDGGDAAVTGVGATKHVITNAWQKFTKTFTMPSTVGKTITVRDYSSLVFWMSAGSDWDSRTASLGGITETFYIAHIQLELGNAASAFEAVDEQEAKLKSGFPYSERQGTGFDNTHSITGNEPALTYARAGRKNLFMNGDFFIDQRGGSPYSAAIEFTADRWIVADSVSTTVSTGLKGGQILISPGAASAPSYLYQPIELKPDPLGTETDQQFRIGTTMTLSFWAYMSGVSEISFKSDYRTISTGGVPINDVLEEVIVPAGSQELSKWVKIVHTFTIQTDPDHLVNSYCPQLLIRDQQSWISQMQLEVGSEATAFEHLTAADQLAACQRYFLTLPTNSVVGTGHFGDSTRGDILIPTPVTMRTLPTFFVDAISGLRIYGGAGTETPTVAQVWSLAPGGIQFRFTLASTATTHRCCSLYSFTETIRLSAEL